MKITEQLAQAKRINLISAAKKLGIHTSRTADKEEIVQLLASKLSGKGKKSNLVNQVLADIQVSIGMIEEGHTAIRATAKRKSRSAELQNMGLPSRGRGRRVLPEMQYEARTNDSGKHPGRKPNPDSVSQIKKTVSTLLEEMGIKLIKGYPDREQIKRRNDVVQVLVKTHKIPEKALEIYKIQA